MLARPAKIYDFTAFARRTPNAQLPADRIDAQLQNHADAITAVQLAVEKLIAAKAKVDDVEIKTLAAEIKAFAAAEFGDLTRSAGYAKALAEQAQHQLKRVWAEADRARDVADRAEARLAAAVLEAKASPGPDLRNEPRFAPGQAMPALGYGAGGFYASDDAGAAAVSADYAQVSIEWAEHMPDTIPPNILAINSISGEHWSSRWWAMRAGNAFGMLAWWYMGAWPGPPPTTPNTPTGDPIPPGGMYFDTDLGIMLVWNGSSWVPLAQGAAAATTASLYYHATAGQTVFPLSVADRYGHTFAFNQTATEGLLGLVNGVRLEPTVDFTVDTVASSVTFLRPLSTGAVVAFDLLTPVSQLSPSGSVNTVLLSQIIPDGVKTVFAGLTVAAGGAVNVAKNEELLVSVNGVQQSPGAAYNATGSTITFVQAPEADALIFIVWFGPSATRSVAPPTHSSQALAYLARTVGGNEGGNGANIATLIDGLVSDGVWAKLDALYVLAQQNQTDALLNLIGTSYSLTVNAILERAVSFTQYVGFSGFDNGLFINTHFNPTTATSPLYVQNSASLGVWSYANANTAGVDIGIDATAANILVSYSNTFYARINGSAGGTPTPGTKGLYVGDRSSSANVVQYWNGASQGAQASTSAAVLNNFFIIGNATGGTFPTSNTLSAAFIGASLGAAGQLALYNRLRTYMTAIGAP